METVGKDRPYVLVPYRKEWIDLFGWYKASLVGLFRDQIIDVHHVGSTSIPNIEVAKPQIDVLVVCKNLETIRKHSFFLFSAGFVVHPESYTKNLDEVYATKDDEFSGMRQVSIHILQEGNQEIEKILAFRDYLIANPKELARYVTFKKGLYNKYPNSHRDYDNEKMLAIRDFLLPQALAWHQNR